MGELNHWLQGEDRPKVDHTLALDKYTKGLMNA
jgi:hypothetical protein